MKENSIKEGRNLAIIAYITILGSVIAYFLNNDKKNPFSAFHIRQGLGLWLMYMLLGFVTSSIDNWFATLGFWIFFGVLFVFGISSAFSGKTQEVPLVGAYFQKTLSKLGI